MNISPFRKQIQKFSLFIAIVLISFSIFPVLIGQKVQAASTCFVESRTAPYPEKSSRDFPRKPVEQSLRMSVTDFPIWDNEPVQFDFTLKYDLNDPSFPRTRDCSSENKFFARFEGDGYLGWYNIGSDPGSSFKMNIQKAGSSTNNPDSIIVKGNLSLGNIMEVINKDIQASIKSSTATTPFKVRMSIVYFTGATFGPNYVSSYGTQDFSIKPCLQPGVTDPENPAFCKPHTQANVEDNNDTTIGNADEIPLKDLAFILDSGVSDKSLLPEKLKSGPYTNFIRVYKEGGKIKDFTISTYMGMTGPPGKDLVVSANKKSRVVFNVKKDSSTKKKDITALGVGFTPAISKPEESYGCEKSDISTSYWYGNESYSYKYCNFAQSFRSGSGISLSTAKDTKLIASIVLNDEYLKRLKADKSVTCQADHKSCDQVYNEINIDMFMGLEFEVGDDTSYFALSPLNGSTALYRAIKNAYLAYNDITLTLQPTTKQHKFYIQIFNNIDDWKANIDAPIPSGIPDYSSSSVGSGVEAQSTVKTLYDFIISIILSIIVFLTSQIYEIFAYFVVPVLKALLEVKPYQDKFVNIIYPGWLILRNLANIFFIISLLVVGLRILFQQSAAATARGFIMRLIIMALLVNFSLVIGQGIVGIADTVQSQFLPAESKVIEALGTKLMVDPVKSFRTAVTGSETGQITGDPNIGDVTKPLVMLILAVAAFFSFIAIAAFLAVRLVALMILYMISPVAYAGFVMDETRSYAKRWWDEFLKYAFVTPILVFFLNIAALVAVSTASSTGNVFKIDEGIEDAFVSGGLTIISHFIVLLIIFAGMKFALSSGHAGAGTIVKYAQKGFENTFKKPAEWLGGGAKGLGKWAKDAGGDLASEAAKKAGYGKTAAAISALTQPALTVKALKGKFIDEPKKKQMERLAEKRTGLEKFASNVGNNKWQATKMAAWKLRGKGAGFFLDQAEDLRGIKTDEEISGIKGSIDSSKNSLEEVNRRLAEGDKYITKSQGEKYKEVLDGSIEDLKKERDEKLDQMVKDKGAAIAVGNKSRVSELEENISSTEKYYADRIAGSEQAHKDIEDRLKALPSDTGADEAMEMADNESAARALTVNANSLKADIDKFEGDLNKDQRLRKLYGYEGQVIDERKKNVIIKQAESLESIAAKREFPNTPGDVSERLAKENEEGKKYDGIDDVDTLKVAFEEALKKNNIPAATALLKKITKEGGSDGLLKDNNYKNNIVDFKKFMDEKLKSVPVIVRNQIASEVSYFAAQNGNRALANATSIDSNRVVRFNTMEQQQAKLEKTAAKKPLWERKKTDLTYQDPITGKNRFNAGEFEAIDKINPESVKDLKRRVKPEVAEHILKTANDEGRVFKSDKIRKALENIVNPTGEDLK